MSPAIGQDEAAEYYFTYINQVPDGDICVILQTQLDETLALLNAISEERSRHRYAPGKWTIKEVANHLNDTERVFTFRALWFARGFPDPLPSFDQNIAIAGVGAEVRPWRSHVEEFRAVRLATLPVFQSLSPEAWLRRGVASGHPVSVRALAYITAGHVAHHARILRERYLSARSFSGVH
jgi:hypothetical protein